MPPVFAAVPKVLFETLWKNPPTRGKESSSAEKRSPVRSANKIALKIEAPVGPGLMQSRMARRDSCLRQKRLSRVKWYGRQIQDYPEKFCGYERLAGDEFKDGHPNDQIHQHPKIVKAH